MITLSSRLCAYVSMRLFTHAHSCIGENLLHGREGCKWIVVCQEGWPRLPQRLAAHLDLKGPSACMSLTRCNRRPKPNKALQNCSCDRTSFEGRASASYFPFYL